MTKIEQKLRKFWRLSYDSVENGNSLDWEATVKVNGRQFRAWARQGLFQSERSVKSDLAAQLLRVPVVLKYFKSNQVGKHKGRGKLKAYGEY